MAPLQPSRTQNSGLDLRDRDCPNGCGLLNKRVSNTAKNPNRKFYSCSSCKFFEWHDQQASGQPGAAGSVPAKCSLAKDRSGDVCWKCNQTGHWANQCPNTGAAAAPAQTTAPTHDDVPSKQCPCGGGMCVIKTSNTKRNPNRRFYKCPAQCSFFEWHDPPVN